VQAVMHLSAFNNTQGANQEIGFVTVFVTDFDKSLDVYTKTLGMEIDYTDKANWANSNLAKT
jgi:hypothetical protein